MDLVLVTSVINISQNPFDYSSVRSIFTHEERFKETIQTIESVRKYIPNVFIVLIEGSIEPVKNIETLKTDYIHYVNHPDIHGLSKAKGETRLLIDYLTSDHFKNLPNIQRVFKLSGRYYLTESFDNSKFDPNYVCVRKYPNYYAPLFYSIPRKYIDWYLTRLNIIQQNPFGGYEAILFASLDYEDKDMVKFIDLLGVFGVGAVNRIEGMN